MAKRISWRAPSEEEKRHCFNVGCVSLEFPRVEEEIGHLMVELAQERRDTGTEYMRYFKGSPSIVGFLAPAGQRHPDAGLDLHDVGSKYEQFADLRNRYSHASVGSAAFVNPETGVLEMNSMQE